MHYLIVIVSTVLFLTTRIEAQREVIISVTRSSSSRTSFFFGDLCVVTGTIQPGVCRHITRCSVVLEAAFHGLPYQVCASPENRLIVCCPWVPGQETRLQARYQANTTTPREGDNCTMLDTGFLGVCSQFGNCHTAVKAASKGKPLQICALEGNIQIVCCPRVTVAEGDQCKLTETGRAGKCLRISKCPVAVEAALKGITPQICALDGSVPVVCCEGVTEGDNCTMVDTGKAGVCKPFANCQTAKEAAHKGISPQICALEDRVQIVCCPPVTVFEGDNCSLVDTGKAGVCRPFANCQTAKEASYKGIFPQTCNVEGSVQIVCCPLSTVVEGSHCTLMHTEIAGVCRPFDNCQTAQGAASKGVLPQKCDLTDNESQLVCCTKAACPALPEGLVTQLPIGSKAADYCIELAEKIHPCQETPFGWTRGDMCPLLTPDSNTIYHKAPMTTTAEAPYYGRIGSGQLWNITWVEYPVSLVSDQWVLSSVSAIDSIGSSNAKFVGLGGTLAPRYNPDETYSVTKQHIHPQLSGISTNIALLRLDREVKFASRILPACLHTGTPLPNSGFIFTVHSYSDYKTSMQRVSREECSKVFPVDDSQHRAAKYDQEICSRPVDITKACPGYNYGSPLTLPNSAKVDCTYLLVGLASWHTTSPCTFINIRISYFIPWIEGIVWPESGVGV